MCIGGTDIRGWRDMGTAVSGFMDGLSLELTDEDTGTPLYYISVRATNGAGELSTIQTSRYCGCNTSLVTIIYMVDVEVKVALGKVVHH